MGDDRAGADRGTAPDPHTAQDRRARADRRVLLDPGLGERPVVRALRRAVGVARARMLVVDEGDAVADEHAIGDPHARADEAVRRDLAVIADRRVALDLDERTDPRVRADPAAIEVHELVDRRAFADDDVRRDRLKSSNHRDLRRFVHESPTGIKRARCYPRSVRSAVPLAVVALACALGPAAASASTVRGLVFDDVNRDGRPSAGEPGVAGAVVAYDVLAFASTDAAGHFELEIPKPASNIVWVRVPDGFVPGPVWKRIVAADEPVELGLRRLAERVHGPLTFVVAADTHLEPMQPFAADLGEVARAATALDPPPAFFTILGDITQSNTDPQFDLVAASLAGLDVPYVPVPGNHDWYDGGAAWFRRYGPDNYSFDLGGVHFVVWNMALPEAAITQYLGAELARVDPAMPVVALTHAPPVPPILDALRRLGVDYVLTGHTHTNRAVDHGGLIELTTEPLLMGGLDFTPAGYRVVTIDGGVLSSYHRTVVGQPLLAMIAPAHGGCLAPDGGPLIVAAELDAGSASVTAQVDCGTPIALRYAGGWSWRTELPALASGPHTIAIDARSPSGMRVSRTVTVEVCARSGPARKRSLARSISGPAPTAASWPQLGGNARHTGATPVAIAPPLGQRWAATVGGHVLAAPAIAGGLVFVTATDLADGRTGGVVAVDLATGATRWRVATPSPVRGSPAVAGDTVAIGQLDGTVLGLDVTTGAIRWRYELGAGLPPEAATLFAAPTADAGDFLVGTQRHLAALGSDVGSALWRVDPVPDAGYSQSLAAVAVADNVAIGVFHRELGGVIAWDRATGRELWRLVGEPAIAINATPVIADDTVYVVNGATEVFALDLASGDIRWQVKLDDAGFDWGIATLGTPAIAAGVLVVPTLYRDLVGLDAATGAELWRFAGTAGPLRTTHYRGTGEAGFEASPVIARDLVWAVDTAGRLSALELATGRALWHADLGVPVLGGLAVAGDWLVVASYDGSVRAFSTLARPGKPASPQRCDVIEPAGCCDANDRDASPLILVVAVWLVGRRRRRASVKGMAEGRQHLPAGSGRMGPCRRSRCK